MLTKVQLVTEWSDKQKFIRHYQDKVDLLQSHSLFNSNNCNVRFDLIETALPKSFATLLLLTLDKVGFEKIDTLTVSPKIYPSGIRLVMTDESIKSICSDISNKLSIDCPPYSIILSEQYLMDTSNISLETLNSDPIDYSTVKLKSIEFNNNNNIIKTIYR